MAADGWQEEYSTMLLKLGFKQWQACPNAFTHPARAITTSVHGGDSTSSGPKDALDWLEKPIGEAYEITIGPRLGPGPRTGRKPGHSIVPYAGATDASSTKLTHDKWSVSLLSAAFREPILWLPRV